MNAPSFRSRSPNKLAWVAAAIAWLALVLAASRETLAQNPPADQSAAETTTTDTATEPETKVPDAELDSLVAPIALYPDPLLSQTLVASTYPVELMQLQQWMGKNTSLKDQALADAVAKQPWDASIQGLATFPEVVETLAGNIQWTSDHRERLFGAAAGRDGRGPAHAGEGSGHRNVKNLGTAKGGNADYRVGPASDRD